MRYPLSYTYIFIDISFFYVTLLYINKCLHMFTYETIYLYKFILHFSWIYKTPEKSKFYVTTSVDDYKV